MTDRWATFDCYGTLIDWEGGIRATFASLWPGADEQALLARYHELEPAIEHGVAIPYREVLTQALVAVAGAESLELDDTDRDALARTLPEWAPFDEVPAALLALRDAGWKLAILSNTDSDLLAASIDNMGVEIDERVVASDAGGYKPAHGHWNTFFERTHADRNGHVHVAASLFHDLAPSAELGLRAVWINRNAQRSDLPRAAELPDLTLLPEILEGLVPARNA